MQNVLFDAETNRITGLIDYEFSQIASAADEFLTASFSRLHHLMPSAEMHDEEQVLLRKSLLTGFDPALAERPTKSGINWKLALMVDQEFAKAGAMRPRDVPGMEEIHRRFTFVDNVMPPMFYAPHIQNAPKEKQDSLREEKRRELEAALKVWGI